MNCSEVQERFSQFYDNRLSQAEAARVAAHTTDCSSCADELTFFQQLSVLSQQLIDPPVPPRLWGELQAKLHASPKPKSFFSPISPSNAPTRLFALAATILIAVGIGTAMHQTWFSPGYNQLAVNFSPYLENFIERPDEAQQIFLAKYDGRPIALTEAENILGYEPAATKGLPPGYSVEEVHLLTMPCCTCTQVICTNESGESLAIFEYALDQPAWFGDRPATEHLCHEVPTSVIQVGDRLAATWKEGERYITIIGATDLDVVTEFVAHFKLNRNTILR
ncbi:MAG: hypothetical protein GXP26_18435 [Planctomycetes bacterium]|nr:hypothetical protein [Planctomycetota bacterium]